MLRRIRNRIIYAIDEFIAWFKFGIAMFIIIYAVICFIAAFGPMIKEIIEGLMG